MLHGPQPRHTRWLHQVPRYEASSAGCSIRCCCCCCWSRCDTCCFWWWCWWCSSTGSGRTLAIHNMAVRSSWLRVHTCAASLGVNQRLLFAWCMVGQRRCHCQHRTVYCQHRTVCYPLPAVRTCTSVSMGCGSSADMKPAHTLRFARDVKAAACSLLERLASLCTASSSACDLHVQAG